MSLIGNIIWLIFGGFLAGLGYILGGLLLCVTIIGIPFGLKSIELGIATMVPFGKAVKQTGTDGQDLSPLRIICFHEQGNQRLGTSQEQDDGCHRHDQRPKID